MKPIPFDSNLWKKLPTAYGMAENVPHRFSECLESSDSSQWRTLYDEVCHQGTPYGCVWALIPHFVKNLDDLNPEGLQIALGIIVANMRYAPEEPPYEELAPPYRSAVAALRAKLVPHIRVSSEALRAWWADRDSSGGEAVFLLAYIAACFERFVCAELFEDIALGEESYVLCPECDELLRVSLSCEGLEAESVDGTRWSNGERVTQVRATEVEGAFDRGRKMLEMPPTHWDDREALLALSALLTDQLGYPEAGRRVVSALSALTCPSCDKLLSLLENLADEP